MSFNLLISVRSIELESEADSDDHEKAGNVSHKYEAARETLKAGDQRTLSSKIRSSNFMISLWRMLISFRHWNKEIEAKVDQVHEAILFMAIFSILSKHADRVIEEPPASSRKRQPWPELGSMVNALIRRALLYIQQCKDPSCSPYLESFLWADLINQCLATQVLTSHLGKLPCLKSSQLAVI